MWLAAPLRCNKGWRTELQFRKRTAKLKSEMREKLSSQLYTNCIRCKKFDVEVQ